MLAWAERSQVNVSSVGTIELDKTADTLRKGTRILRFAAASAPFQHQELAPMKRSIAELWQEDTINLRQDPSRQLLSTQTLLYTGRMAPAALHKPVRLQISDILNASFAISLHLHERGDGTVV